MYGLLARVKELGCRAAKVTPAPCCERWCQCFGAFRAGKDRCLKFSGPVLVDDEWMFAVVEFFLVQSIVGITSFDRRDGDEGKYGGDRLKSSGRRDEGDEYETRARLLEWIPASLAPVELVEGRGEGLEL